MIKIAIIGTGGMANSHATGFAKIPGCRLVAGVDIDRDRVDKFAAKHGIPRVFTSVDDLLTYGKFDAVANVTPDAQHAPLSLKAIAAGKHVLCEKPLATCYADAAAMADAAAKAGVINMVNFSYRNSAAIHRATKLIQAGEIGRIVHVEAHYLQGWLGSLHWGDWRERPGLLWRLSKGHGSQGVLGDIGVHIVDFATYPAGPVSSVHCKLKTFTQIKGAEYDEYKLDANDSALITAELENGALATISTTRWAVGQPNTVALRIYGEKGGIRIDLDKSYTEFEVCRGKDAAKAAWKTVKCAPTPNMYQRFVKSIRTGKNDQPDFATAARVQKVLDACFESDETGKTIKL
jgi:predicted dehydrogenase